METASSQNVFLKKATGLNLYTPWFFGILHNY